MDTVQDDGEYNLQEAWDKACASFAQKTKVDLTITPKYSVDEILDRIRAKQDEDDEKNNKYRAAKDAIGNTLKFVMLLGGIAAQGASIVFAPAGLCFNAVSYLVDTGARYKRIFSGLAELFRRISDVLERCKIYLRLPADAVDVALRKIINQELVCFVDICALAIKVLKGHKVFIALKVFVFDSDEGVSGQLAHLATLVERESQMRATLGFESQKLSERNIIENRDSTRKINGTVNKLLNFEKKRDADTALKKLLNNIDSNLDVPSEDFQIVQTTLRRLLSDQVQGSGEWLRSDPRYGAWATLDSLPFLVLGISGDEGHGKSFLFTSIVKFLQEAQPESENDMRCTSTAYHIFDKDKYQISLVQGLKVLAWQIADQDIVYRKDVSSVKATGVNQIGTLWDILFSKSYKSDSVIFLLLDGIDQIEKSELKEFTQVLEGLQASSGAWSQFKLRIVITGRNEAMSKLKGGLREGISIIDVTSENNDDVEKFIIDRMNKMEILSGSSEQVLSLRGDILQNLKTQTHGDFVNISLLLQEISGKQRPGEIRDILSHSGGKRSDTIMRRIEFLNETLSEDDISDLNILLTWVIFSNEPWLRTLEDLEGVLYLKAGESSLRPLAEKITDQYSSLLRINGEPHPITKIIPKSSSYVEIISSSIEEFIRNRPEFDNPEDSSALDIAGDISEVEVRIVRRFLESVCDPSLFAKFGFEEFFQRKLKGKTARVGVDIDTAHLSILSTCLKVIHHQESPELESLLTYASEYFADHLEQADPSLTQPQHKAALGPQLVSLFTDEEVIKKWWDPTNTFLRYRWILQDDYAEAALKWLQDSAVTKSLSDDQKVWVKSLSSKSEPDADILEHVAKFTARLWLQPDVGVSHPSYCLAAIHEYLTKIESRKNPKIKRPIDWARPEAIDASKISDAAEWARQKLGLDSLGYGETRNLAHTFRDCGQFAEAIEHFKLSCSLQQYNWLSLWGLSTVYAYQGEYALAIETLEAAKNTIKCHGTGEDDIELLGMDREIAQYHGKLGNNDKAFAIYEKMLSNDPSDYDAAFGMMIQFHKTKNSEGLLKFLDSLQASMDDSTGLDRRTQSFHQHYDKDEFHEAILGLVSGSNTFDAIFNSYQEAVVAAKEQLTLAVNKGDVDKEGAHRVCQAHLMHNLALLCYDNSSENDERREFAIGQWVQVLQIDEIRDETFVSIAKSKSWAKLANVYFHEAMRDPKNAATYLDQLEDLATWEPAYYIDGFRRSTAYVSELVARYHALKGDEQKAKDALRIHVKRTLDYLSDDNPLNDWLGYLGLARHLMFAGHDADCLAAWSLIIPSYEETGPEDAETKPTLQTLRGPMLELCEGCRSPITYPNNIHMCRECDYTHLDDPCYIKLREGTLEKRICDKEHEILHIPPYDAAERERVGEGNVLLGEEIISVSEWLQRIKEKWDLDSAL